MPRFRRGSAGRRRGRGSSFRRGRRGRGRSRMRVRGVKIGYRM